MKEKITVHAPIDTSLLFGEFVEVKDPLKDGILSKLNKLILACSYYDGDKIYYKFEV